MAKNDFDVYICRNCKTIYSFKEEMGEVFDYPDYYREEPLKIPGFVACSFTEIIRAFEKYRQNNRFLDFGCGAGSLLKAAISESWEAEGVEVSRSSVEYLQKQNVKVIYGDLTANFAENSFDVITAVEILEHIPDPDIVLKEIYRILRPGGLMWVITLRGNRGSRRLLRVERTYVGPLEHLHLFSVKGIKNLLTKAGFRNVWILTQGVNPFKIIHALRYGKKSRQSATISEKNQASEPVFDRADTAYESNSALSKSTGGER